MHFIFTVCDDGEVAGVVFSLISEEGCGCWEDVCCGLEGKVIDEGGGFCLHCDGNHHAVQVGMERDSEIMR